MVLENPLLPYWTWLTGYPYTDQRTFLDSALFRFMLTAIVLAVLSLVVGYLIALVRHGPLKAGDITYRVVVNGFRELFLTSPRRVWAIARLAVKESIRRRVIIAPVLYIIILIFSSWYVPTGVQQPGKLFFSYVLGWTTLLVLLISLLVAAFSLPNDFKSKTIYTVVTKPVRAGDLILGRILGFTIVGTVILLVMAACSAVFVWRMLDHTHQVKIESLENVYDSKNKNQIIGKKGRTTTTQNHSHEVEIYPDGSGVARSTNEHEHDITSSEQGGETVYRVGPPRGLLRARVPQYGKVEFTDRKGNVVTKGVSVGNEWTYRSFIEGGTPMAAVWTFSGINESSLRDGQVLPIELIVRVFRTFKGDIETGIQGVVQLRNPVARADGTYLKSEPWTFKAKDASINTFDWSRSLRDAEQKKIDLLKDLVSEDGQIDVVVQCLDRAQYYGFALPDCYIRLPDGSPMWNFCKAQATIWIQMVLVIAIGVTCSTLVNAPVAMLFTISFITLGFFRQFFLEVAIGKQVGGGPIESMYRIATQMNQVSPLPENFGTRLIQDIDHVLKVGMQSLTYVLPDFRSFSSVDYVAYGFHIPMNLIYQNLTVCAAYLLGLSIIGYFFLRTREVAK